MHACLNWSMVEDRLVYSLLVFFRNILVSKIPFILYDYISFTSDSLHHSTRHASDGKLALLRAQTNAVKRIVMYQAMNEWNLLPNHFRLENKI